MSINMTQKFEFETDDIKSFETILNTIVPILFHRNGKYTKLNIRKNSNFIGSWKDGINYAATWESKPSVIMQNAASSGSLVNTADGIYGGCEKIKVIAKKSDLDEAVKYANKFINSPSKPTRLFISRLSDYIDDYNKDEDDLCCSSYEDMIDKTMEILKNFDANELFRKLGNGYCSWFNMDDGSTGIAYRMHTECVGGWEKLFISLTHAFYGK